MEYVALAAGVIALAVVALVAYAATRPDHFRVERSAVIPAPPDRVFPLLTDFRRWRDWSPWDRMDPDLKRTYAGPDRGVGAVYEWAGNKKVGRGRMEIVDAVPTSRVTIQLDFLHPFEAHNTAEFALEPAAGGTTVTWAMTGRQPFFLKLMSVVLSMDRMVGKDFEAGLNNLKAAAAGPALADAGR